MPSQIYLLLRIVRVGNISQGHSCSAGSSINSFFRILLFFSRLQEVFVVE